MKKAFSYFFISILLIGLLAACGSSEEASSNGSNDKGSDKKVLTMGTSADYPPFEYIDTAKGDDIIGIDIDIAKAVTEKLGYEFEVRDMDFGGLIQALKSGQVDFVLSAMNADDERRKSVDFSDTYYTSKHMIVSKKDSGITKVEDLEGKKVGAQLGSIQEDKANELAEEIDMAVESRNRVPELIQEIKAGRLDAVIIEDTVSKGYLENNKDIDGFTIEDTDGGYAIALPKDSELTEEFNKALKELIDNGELDKILKKWFEGE
ncbi:polar amino acid transport system substrate-binding protein [Cytobacillus eiseniae]|uniref:Polar amino acid transport system substrate-binding protein n=1 Tax=Cytobacillus eiseniae TaxID=762947 RepID=A0ABS4RD29_9BACI|nr:transporter substrate-binding domain-containing protein [Cytobacillus eiseniae]MBP2240798.1 polar amino acid transport system substrate-binding protein [Cytobacillus eiseniae]